jgi:hypothetical protein
MNFLGYAGLSVLVLALLFALSPMAMESSTMFIEGKILGGAAELEKASKETEQGEKAAQAEEVNSEMIAADRRMLLEEDRYIAEPARLCRETPDQAQPTPCADTSADSRLPMDGGATAAERPVLGLANLE